ncbi:MAG: ribonuclease Z [Bacteroidales bacterium]|nr:ribonuclease Z [Bacteroidales bacterium]MBN2757324.1 ribonuclease Z [Bacteroidales bacterium]
MTFSITVLGSSSALPTAKRFPTAHLLNAYERFFLIDCGEGTQIQLRKFKLKFSKINHIFISHLHGDHYFGLFGLLSSFSLLGRRNALNIYAHSELENILNNQFKYYELQFKINFHKLPVNSSEIIYEDKNIFIETFPLKHRIPTNGFLFKEKKRDLNLRKDVVQEYKLSVKDILSIKQGNDYFWENGEIIKNTQLTHLPYKTRAYAFCSDTAFYPEIVKYISNADILYHEATFTEEMKDRAKNTYHSTALQAAEIAKMANVKKLLIGHFSSRYKDISILENEARSIFENTLAVIEGGKYTIEQEREIN